MSQLMKNKIGQQVRPYKKGGAVFEASTKDVEVKGKGKEGSKKEEKFDKSQMKKGGKC